MILATRLIINDDATLFALTYKILISQCVLDAIVWRCRVDQSLRLERQVGWSPNAIAVHAVLIGFETHAFVAIGGGGMDRTGLQTFDTTVHRNMRDVTRPTDQHTE